MLVKGSKANIEYTLKESHSTNPHQSRLERELLQVEMVEITDPKCYQCRYLNDNDVKFFLPESWYSMEPHTVSK